MLLALYP